MPERRRKPRVPWIRFKSEVKIRRTLFYSEWVEVYPFDFNRYGTGVQTDEQFEVGETIVLSLSLEMEAGSIYVDTVPAIVRRKQKHHSRFNYGVEFDYSSRVLGKSSVISDLEHIESVLKKHCDLQARINGIS